MELGKSLLRTLTKREEMRSLRMKILLSTKTKKMMIRVRAQTTLMSVKRRVAKSTARSSLRKVKIGTIWRSRR